MNQPTQHCIPHRKDDDNYVYQQDEDDADLPTFVENVSGLIGNEPMVQHTGSVDGFEEDTSYMRETPLVDKGNAIQGKVCREKTSCIKFYAGHNPKTKVNMGI